MLHSLFQPKLDHTQIEIGIYISLNLSLQYFSHTYFWNLYKTAQILFSFSNVPTDILTILYNHFVVLLNLPWLSLQCLLMDLIPLRAGILRGFCCQIPPAWPPGLGRNSPGTRRQESRRCICELGRGFGQGTTRGSAEVCGKHQAPPKEIFKR